MLQAVEERLRVPLVHLAFEHAADALNGLFTAGPVVLRLLALHGTKQYSVLPAREAEPEQRFLCGTGLPQTAVASKRTRSPGRGSKQSIA